MRLSYLNEHSPLQGQPSLDDEETKVSFPQPSSQSYHSYRGSKYAYGGVEHRDYRRECGMSSHARYTVVTTAPHAAPPLHDCQKKKRFVLGLVVASLLGSALMFWLENAPFVENSSASSLKSEKDAVSMPTRFHTVIELSMPYIGIVEPLEVWSDLDAGLQHINYWGPLNQFYLNRTGTGCQVVPVSFNGATSEEVCG